MKNRSYTDDILLARQVIEANGLYLLKKEDLKFASDIAGEAYGKYPLNTWFAGGINRPQLSSRVLEISLKSFFDRALIYSESKEMNGLAVWVPMQNSEISSLSFLFHGGTQLLFKEGIGFINRLSSYEKYAANLKHKLGGECDWYFYNLTVSPESQGKGIARRLLNPMLKLCDEKGHSCYLETNLEKNISLYEHFGFSLCGVGTVPKSDVKHFSMCRFPK